MKFHDFSPFYRSGEGIRSKVAGDRLIDNPAVADAQGGSGASYSFDGTDDEIAIGDTDNLSFGNGTSDNPFSLSAWIYVRDAAYFPVINKGGYNTVGEWHFGASATGELRLSIYDESVGSTYQMAEVSSALTTDEWVHVCATYNGVGGTNANAGISIYYNGVSQNLTLSSGGTYVAMENLGTEVRIGNYIDTYYADGQISQVRIHNRALSADEVRASYNGQAVGFEYRGGGQNVVIGDSSTFTNSKGGWSVSGAATISEAGVFDLNGGYGYLNIDSASPYGNVEEGRKYRITGDISSVTGTWSFWYYQSGPTEYVQIASGTGDLSVDFEIPSNYNNYFRFLGSGGDVEFTLDNFKITKIGCVAEYLPESISDNSWLDTSGNELDGSVSGATAVNAESGIVGRDSHLLESKTVADLQSGASFSFDGSDDRVTNTANSVTSSADVTASAWIKTTKSTGDMMVLGLGNAHTTSGIDWYLRVNEGVFDAMAYRYSGYLPIASSGVSVADGEWHHLAMVITDRVGASTSYGSRVEFYVDGVLASSIGPGDSTTNGMRNFKSDAASIVGEFWTGSRIDAGSDFFDGEIRQARVHNRALSSAEVRAAYNGQAVPFEYVGGSQDELVTAWTNSDFDDFTSSGTTITEAESDGTGDQNCFSQMPVETGKKYQMTCTVGGTVGDDLSFKVAPNSVALNSAIKSHDITATGSTTFTWIQPDDPDNVVYVGFRSEEKACDFTISDFSVVQIGCVAEYLPSGINATQWVDTSGNGLHGTTSTATAVNHTTGALTMVDDIKLQAGAGINFSNYGAEEEPDVAATDVTGNLLDDYEEGTWTATCTASGFDVNTSYDTGSYTKIGRMVHIAGEFLFTGTPTTGDFILEGLPFSLGAGGEYSEYSSASVYADNLASAIDGYITGLTVGDQLYIRECGTTGAGSDLLAHIDTGTIIVISLVYYTDA